MFRNLLSIHSVLCPMVHVQCECCVQDYWTGLDCTLWYYLYTVRIIEMEIEKRVCDSICNLIEVIVWGKCLGFTFSKVNTKYIQRMNVCVSVHS